jgi:4-alpha-glucanotransferase
MTTLLDRRRAGVLLHPSSLPGAGYCGTFGSHARRFVDLLSAASLQVWQVLPLGPTHEDFCPYQSLSVHAGSPDLIDLEWLLEYGLLTATEAETGCATAQAKRRALALASERFFAGGAAASPLQALYREFQQQAGFWLEDYARFRAFRDEQGGTLWSGWPAGLRNCVAGDCEERARALAGPIAEERFTQFVFACQWRELRRYANEKGILLFGDVPIYVHLESADVWAHQDLFDLDERGQPVTVTGVPPDYFCDEGQLWGNPQYNWQKLAETGFEWWLQRFASAQRQFDIVRIDHFRALEAYWEIPAKATSAREGKWVPAPGRALLQAVRERFPGLCLVAENLGVISPEVEKLRKEFALPGMVILQFAFDGNPDNPYLTHHHAREDVVYTGTHDNNTTLGWFESLDEATQANVYRYFENPDQKMPWMLIRQALASPANTAIVPWQDFLGLDGSHRMNTPGTRDGNWRWRFDWAQVEKGLSTRIQGLVAGSDRLPPKEGNALRVAGE